MEVRNGVFHKGHVRAATVIIVVSCSAGPTDQDGQPIDFGSEPPPSADEPYSNIAYAAIADANSDAATEPVMPLNPSHISIRLPKVPEVQVVLLSGQAYPYPFTVMEEADSTVVTLYLPQDCNTGIRVRPVEQVGFDSENQPLYQPVDSEISFTVEPEAKLGTNELAFGGSHTTINFSGSAQNTLKMGENILQGPVTQEYIDGRTRQVMHGLHEAEHDQICHVSWTGTEKVYSFLDGPPECRTEPFDVQLKAGQRLGLYPIVESETEAVRILLEP